MANIEYVDENELKKLHSAKLRDDDIYKYKPLDYFIENGLVNTLGRSIQDNKILTNLSIEEVELIHKMLTNDEQMVKGSIENGVKLTAQATQLLVNLYNKNDKLFNVKLTLPLMNDSYLNEGKNTLLHGAARSGDIELLDIMISKGVNLDMTNEISATALSLAIDKGHKEVVSLLLNKGVDINRTAGSRNIGLDNCSPLWAALFRWKEEIAKIILARKPKLDIQDSKYGYTALHIAAYKGYNAIVEELLQQKAIVNLVDTVPVQYVNDSGILTTYTQQAKDFLDNAPVEL